MRLALGLSLVVHLGIFLWFPLRPGTEYAVRAGPRSHDLAVVEFQLEPADAPPASSRRESPAASDLGEVAIDDHPDRSEVARPWCGPSRPSAPGVACGPTPDYLQNEPPRYPIAARYMGYQGLVLLRVVVRGDGRCGDITIATSSGHEILDRAAVRAVSRWRFKPATYLGIPLAVRVDVPIRFRLEEGELYAAAGGADEGG